MLELYMKLFEARSVNFEAKGGGSGIGRDEVLGAAALATNKHPLGNRVVLAEMGDQHSITELADWAKGILPDLYQEVVAVALGRPLPEQLEQLIKVNPRYAREHARYRKLRADATHQHKCGHHHNGNKLELEADAVLYAAHEHCKRKILSNGKCPRCNGTGRMERKDEPCPICNGTGNVLPTVKGILQKHGPEVYSQFVRLVDIMQMDKSDWMRLFARHVSEERAA